MKLSTFAASAIFAFCAVSANAATSPAPETAAVNAMPAADPGDLVTRVSEDGKTFQVQQPDGSFTNLQLTQTSDDVIAVTDGKEIGQFIAASDSFTDQCANNGCVHLAWWGGFHHAYGWGHFGWRGHYWWPHRHFDYGGWRYHHWHRGFWHHGW